MRICAIADMHGRLPEVPECDVLVIGGDICPWQNEDWLWQRWWLHSNFEPWLREVPAQTVVAIAGNHDWIFQEIPEEAESLPWQYLNLSTTRVQIYDEGEFSFWGSPWASEFGRWAFMAEERLLEDKYAYIPHDMDVLLSHGPPYGARDQTAMGAITGSPSLRHEIVAKKPKLVVCGHIHEGYGYDRIGSTLVANAAIVDLTFEPVNKPLLIDVRKDGYAEPVS